MFAIKVQIKKFQGHSQDLGPYQLSRATTHHHIVYSNACHIMFDKKKGYTGMGENLIPGKVKQLKIRNQSL